MADRCQWPSRRLDYALGDDKNHEGCSLVEHAASLFVDASGDAITVPTGYARRKDFPSSILKLIAPA
ncbi:hypothetical protein AAC387_Pa02g1485 [Persea americana]